MGVEESSLIHFHKTTNCKVQQSSRINPARGTKKLQAFKPSSSDGIKVLFK